MTRAGATGRTRGCHCMLAQPLSVVDTRFSYRHAPAVVRAAIHDRTSPSMAKKQHTPSSVRPNPATTLVRISGTALPPLHEARQSTDDSERTPRLPELFPQVCPKRGRAVVARLPEKRDSRQGLGPWPRGLHRGVGAPQLLRAHLRMSRASPAPSLCRFVSSCMPRRAQTPAVRGTKRSGGW